MSKLQKIKLSEKQIDELLDFIKPNPGIPEEIAKSIQKKNVEDLKQDLRNIEIYPDAIPQLQELMIDHYYKTLIHPGESVGIITAQSIGERQTQQTLNSVDYTQKVMIKNGFDVKVKKIGEFINHIMSQKLDNIVLYKNQEYLDINSLNYEIPTTDENGKTSWKKIEAVTRHPGEVIKVITNTGREVIASLGKSFIIKKDEKLVEIDGKDLKLGDKLVIVKKMNDDFEINQIKIDNINYDIDYKFLFFYGLFLRNGFAVGDFMNLLVENLDDIFLLKKFFKQNDINVLTKDKESIFCISIRDQKIYKFIERYNSIKKLPNFLVFNKKVNIEYFLKGYLKHFDKELSQVFKVKNKEICSINYLLNKLGIITSFYKEKNYYILQTNIQKEIFNDVYLDEIISIERINATTKYLYDFTVAETRNFNLFNGLVQRDTFHTTGLSIKTVLAGVPRFSELLNATKEPKAKSSQVFFTKENESISSLRNLINHQMTSIKFKDLHKGYKILKNENKEDWIEIFEELHNIDISNYQYLIAVKINFEKLFEYKIPLSLVAEKLEENYDGIVCVYSPLFIQKFYIFVDVSEFKLLDDCDEEECYEMYIKDGMMSKFLNKVKICGIDGIENIFYDKKENEWFVDTEGSNFLEIMCLKDVDKVRTITNDMWEIYNILGIEAARNYLIEEFGNVISSDGTFVNQSHILLLVDVMTFTGGIMSISRYFHKKENCGPMAKASFEESLENFLKAGLYGEKESTNGVSASVMLGKVPRVGTGLCDVMIDIESMIDRPKVLGDVKEKDN